MRSSRTLFKQNLPKALYQSIVSICVILLYLIIHEFGFMNPDYEMYESKAASAPQGENNNEKFTKQHYTYLVKELLCALEEHHNFENNYPDLATSPESNKIRGYLEERIVESMRMLYCHEQLELLESMLLEDDQGLEGYLSELTYMLKKEIEDVKLEVNLEKSQEIYESNEWEQLIDSAKFNSKNQSKSVDWTGINTPLKSPEYLETIIKIFPNQDRLVSSSRKLQEHVKCSILGKDILDRSLNLGSAAFEIESSTDKEIKSNMRPEGQQSYQQMDV